MPFKIVRNDITKMQTEAIVNTANDHPTVGTGCDYAVYMAAGYDDLLAYRKENIGVAAEGDAFITPGFDLPAKYIIHAVSPLYIDGNHGEEELLRSCYRKSLALAKEHGIRSIAFPLISTGGFGYPKEEGMRIAVDEIHAFLLTSDMQIYLVVFGEKATRMGRNLYPDLETYIDLNYVQEKSEEEYGSSYYNAVLAREKAGTHERAGTQEKAGTYEKADTQEKAGTYKKAAGRRRPWPWSPESPEHGSIKAGRPSPAEIAPASPRPTPAEMAPASPRPADGWTDKEISAQDAAIEEMERKLNERIAHMSDTFSEYLFYLISEKGMSNTQVYKQAIVDKKVFSKIKNNPGYHPQKRTALCLCIGARLSMDETRDLLARAGYALSPCDMTDIIFSYFIEHGIYDMIELDIQLEEHGLPCIIT